MTEVEADNCYLYDAEGQICAVSTTPVGGMTVMTGYLYGADGTRVAKGGHHVHELRSYGERLPDHSRLHHRPPGEQLTEMDANGASGAGGGLVWDHTNVWAAGQLIATFDKDSVTGPHYMLNDWLGSRRVQTDASGVYEQSCQSLPYGDGLNCTGSTTTPTEHHFTGKERDAESGNDYFGARYYASSMGRFLSPDWAAKVEPVPYAVLGDPQSLNLYAYVRNNPLTRVDADGHCDKSGMLCQAWTWLTSSHSASASASATAAQGGAANGPLSANAKVGTAQASASASYGTNTSVSGKASASVTTTTINEGGHSTTEADTLTANAGAHAGVGLGGKSGVGISAGASANADVLSASQTETFTLGPITITGTATGNVGLGANASFSLGTGGISASAGVTPGYGGSLSLGISWGGDTVSGGASVKGTMNQTTTTIDKPEVKPNE